MSYMSTELKWIFACAALVAGETLGFATPAAAGAWPLAAALVALVALMGYGYEWRPWPWVAAFAAGFALALAAVESRMESLDALLELNGGAPSEAVFVIGDDVRAEDLRCSFNGRVRGIPVRVFMTLAEGAEAPRAGETWEMKGWLDRRSDGLFGGRRRAFWVRGRGSAARRLAAADRSALRRVRADLARRAGLGLERDGEAADLMRAMLLGARGRLDRDTREAFVGAGTVHLFAISGLHVLLVAKLFMLALTLARVPIRWSGVALMPLLWGYVALTGSGPSAVRAATMASVAGLAPVFWRRPNGFTAWSVAFLATYMRDPEMVYDVGCSFSFAVMFALVAWGWWSAPFKSGRIMKAGVTLVAWAAGVPIAAHVFGRITPGGLVANFVAVPVAVVAVFAGALGILASFLSDFAAVHFNNFAALATGFLADLSRLVASRSWSSRDVEPWSLGVCVAWYAAFAAALLTLRIWLLRRRRRL